MFDFDSIKDGIYEWINSVSGLEAVRADQNAPKRNNSFFTYKLNSILQIGEDYLSEPDDNGLANVCGSRDFTCQILGFGDGIMEKTEALRSSLQIPDILDALGAKKIVVFDRSGIEDLTALDESEFEARSSLDVFMRSEMITTGVDIGAIKIMNGIATFIQPEKPDITRNYSIDSTI